ncbi:MAG: hypothetical protein R3C28_32155 [Pirellulaceae bacterium]
MRSSSTIVIVTALALLPAARSEAFLGQAVRRTVNTVAKKSGKVVQKGTATTARRVAPKTLAKGTSVATKVGVKGSTKASRPVLASGTTVLAKTGSSASRRVANNLGVEGATVLQQLTPSAGELMADMSIQLAKSPHRDAWLNTIAKHGDRVVNWLWKHKAKIAVGATATAVALHPDEFMEFAGDIAESSVEAAGKHLVEPIAKSAADQLAVPVMAGVARMTGIAMFWTVGGLIGYLVLNRSVQWAWKKAKGD